MGCCQGVGVIGRLMKSTCVVFLHLSQKPDPCFAPDDLPSPLNAKRPMPNAISQLPTVNCQTQIPNNARTLGLSMDRKSSLVLANCHDRTLRLYELGPRSAAEDALRRQAQVDGRSERFL